MRSRLATPNLTFKKVSTSNHRTIATIFGILPLLLSKNIVEVNQKRHLIINNFIDYILINRRNILTKTDSGVAVL